MVEALNEPQTVENLAIEIFKKLGYNYKHGSKLTPENKERPTYRDVILKNRFISAIKKLNPWLNDKLAEEVYKIVSNIDHPDPIIRGKIFYDMLISGVKITYKESSNEKTRIVKLIDFSNPYNNDFLISNQFEVEYYKENNKYRIPDLVVFINGIPIAIFEFKGFKSDYTAKDAFEDHKIKKEDIPQLYQYAQILVASDGLETRYGSPTSDWERFFVWEGIESDDDVIVIETEEKTIYEYKCKTLTSLEVLLLGLFDKRRLIEYIEDFIIYDKSGKEYIKKIATYYQFYTVKKAIERTIKAVKGKDKRIGVVWHTQGSGKSLTMLFYAKKALKVKELENPILLFITDRRELDEQLYGIFKNVFPTAKHIETIKELQETLKKAKSGIFFATIQKFGRKNKEEYPFLTDKNNIIVVVDEAHRSQYRQLAQNLRKAIPNASFIGFTATPIDYRDRSTTLVFGDYISIYSIDKAKRHGVVVPIYYEARCIELHLTNEFIDLEFEEISENLIPEEKEEIKRAFAKLERIMLTDEYLDKISKDIVEHFNKRVTDLDGKAMVVTISRKVAVELYKRITKHPNAPSVAVVISGNKSKDPKEFHDHIRSKKELEELARKFKDPNSDPKMVIVVDMWLTGFDVPCLHTMYFWKPMKNHSLVQAIARVNRVFKNKPGGLIVDYIGISDDLKKSLSKYTSEQIKEVLTNIEEIVALLKEKYKIVSLYFKDLNYKNWKHLSSEELAHLTAKAYEMIAKDEKIKEEFLKNFIALKKLYLLASPHPEAIKIREDLAFFEMIKKMLVKYSIRKIKELSKEIEKDMSRLISKSVSASDPIDVFELLNKDKPDISIFSDEFLDKIKNIEYKNLAVDMLIKILNDNLKVKTRTNPWRYKSLYDRLKELIDKHNRKIIETSEMILKLIEIAKDIKKAEDEGKKLNLNEEEYTFYSLLLSYPNLPIEEKEKIKDIAKEIAKTLSGYIKVSDWKRNKFIKSKIKAEVKRILMKKGILEYSILNKLSNIIVEHAKVME
ncbi:HsdR family type I site-specific deoxyribonuclease [Methanocaldococcus villosus KIN24-T80]|uniref:type I site-specific deoxyribonuclease n=1 Tax=Methanocaldococcus villosus KIN24-T80 TaxID=1069083 RepID=N6V1S1_9EURY|nr:HsdR family type I site-specific deoxyribonuclease [Methanocaldococcus villosus]ENN96238.1 HsdR family type I site-specific deoxyribonuclease [Methanocaldococcus villosus KIN24-T80]